MNGESTYKGLTRAEVDIKRHEVGFNEIPEVKQNPVIAFLRKFTGLIQYIIEFSILISLLIGRFPEAAVMGTLLTANAIIGFVEENRSSRAVELLKQKVTIDAKVLRDGAWGKVPTRELVPGDVVKVMLGDVVPADVCLLEGFVLMDQSTLTGESMPVEKKTEDAIYAGSFVARGDAIGEVTATGVNTYFGRTAQLLQLGRAKLAIETITLSVTKYLLMLDAIFIGVVALQFLLLGQSLVNILTFLLALLIGSIPVALPTMSTVALSLGAVELSRQGVIVRKLNAVESAAMMDVTCLDKTGTITENKLSIIEVLPLDDRYDSAAVVNLAVMASEAVTSDPIDLAITAFAQTSFPGNVPYEVIDFKAFDPRTKRAEAIVRQDGRTFTVMKGAPQVLVTEASMEDMGTFNETLDNLAQQGSRTLAVAVRDGDETVIVGLLAIQDNPRPDSAALIAKLKFEGITVKMITGDNYAVARAIAGQVGIGGNIVRMQDVSDLHDPQTLPQVEHADAVAEVVPEDKYNIIDLLQTAGHHVVGMTGDGVNDAPALHKAEVGIAVSNATDVARSSAQILLSQPGIQNIVDLVVTGRSIYRRIVIWVLNKIIKTFQIVFFVSLATLLLHLPVITSIQMLLILFLFDFVTISISADNVTPASQPEKWDLKKMVGLPSLIGALNVGESFLALAVGMFWLGLSTSAINTFVFYQIFLSGLLNIFSVRENGHFWASKPRTILWGIITADICVGTVIVLAGLLMTPLALSSVLFLGVFEIATILGLNDVVKYAVNKRKALLRR
ncbi:MAG TPA: plasma-membrane proton-efflux P-type ATPase [Candidatus Lokiarchaeia archaeon]|nr:plasma-membrane proton-efflux P-type ATPase [Candidatus Lokiarchaeia archaeon]